MSKTFRINSITEDKFSKLAKGGSSKDINQEKYLKWKEIQQRYTNLHQSRTMKVGRHESPMKGGKKVFKVVAVGTSDKGTQTKYLGYEFKKGSLSNHLSSDKINEVEKQFNEIKNAHGVKESHLKLEIIMLKAKLEEQKQTNLGQIRISELEHKVIDSLASQINDYFKNEGKVDLENTKRFTNSDSKERRLFTPSTADKKASSEGSSDKDVISELDPSLSDIKSKVEMLLKMNKNLRQELDTYKTKGKDNQNKIKIVKFAEDVNEDEHLGYSSCPETDDVQKEPQSEDDDDDEPRMQIKHARKSTMQKSIPMSYITMNNEGKF